MSTTALAVLSATCTVLLVLLLLGSPGEVEIVPLKPRVGTGPASDLSPLTAELAQLKTLLAEQQAATLEHRELVAQFAAGQASVSGGVAGEAAGGAAGGAAAAAAPLADSAELERAALAACTPGDVPILGVMRSPCPPGMHGYGCKVRWDLGDRFVPEGGRWLSEFNASHRAVVNCQRGFFDAFAERLARAHWETEWDAQPFRIAAAPPRTIGKMMHQLTTANYFQLTSSPTQQDKNHKRLPLRSAAAPGSHYVRMPDPGFRWNVLDYGKGNIFADPLRHGTRCAKSHSAWHCLWQVLTLTPTPTLTLALALALSPTLSPTLAPAPTLTLSAWHWLWQRFPHQRAARSAPPPESALGTAADELYNLSRSGRATRRLVQYLIMTGVTQVEAAIVSSVAQP